MADSFDESTSVSIRFWGTHTFLNFRGGATHSDGITPEHTLDEVEAQSQQAPACHGGSGTLLSARTDVDARRGYRIRSRAALARRAAQKAARREKRAYRRRLYRALSRTHMVGEPILPGGAEVSAQGSRAPPQVCQ